MFIDETLDTLEQIQKDYRELAIKYSNLCTKYENLLREHLDLQRKYIDILNERTPRNPEDAYREDFHNE